MISSFSSLGQFSKNHGGGVIPPGVDIGKWVAVGNFGIIANSIDGNVWTPAASSGGITSSGYGVAYGKNGTGAGLWVAVGGGWIIAKSTDGNVWTVAAGANFNKGGLTRGDGIAYGKDALGAGLWVAVGLGGLIAKSSDGHVWTAAATVSGVTGKGGITNNGWSVAYGKDGSGVGLWVAGGGGGILAKSTDGNIWTSVAGPATSKGGITGGAYGVAYGKDAAGIGLWVAVGGGVIIAKSYDGNIWTSSGGNGTNKGGITTNNGYGVAYGKDGSGVGLWVAVGDTGIIAKSYDVNVWTPAATVDGVAGKGGITTTGHGVAYGKDETGAGLWVVVGQDGVIAKSTDGNVWTPAATVSGVSGKGGITDGRAVAFNTVLPLID